jgi:hypothetical protein
MVAPIFTSKRCTHLNNPIMCLSTITLPLSEHHGTKTLLSLLHTVSVSCVNLHFSTANYNIRMTATNPGRWLNSVPPRYSPASTRRPHSAISQISVAETSSGALTKWLAYDRFTQPKWCSFSVPATDDLIRADIRASVPEFPVPDQRDGFTIVRRYMYNILTSTGWGISDKYPAAVRCTVQSWYGNGGFFRAQCEKRDGLKWLCPGEGKDDQGVEVSFDDQLRERIRECVRYESSILMQEETGIEDAVSVAGSYAAGGATEEYNIFSTEVPEYQVGNVETPPDQLSLPRSRSSSSIYSEEEDVEPEEVPARYDSARSSTVKPDVSTSEILATSYEDLVRSSLEAEYPFETTPAPTTDEDHPSELSHHDLPQTTPGEDIEALHHKNSVENLTTPTITKPFTKESISPTIASKRSIIKRMTSTIDFPPNFTSPPKEKRPGNPKKVMVGTTSSTEAKPRVSGDMIKTMDNIMQGKKTQRAPSKKKQESPSREGQAGSSSRTTSNSKMQHHTSEEPLFASRKDDSVIVAAATAAAQRARQLKLEEAKQLNHHHERKKANLFTKVFWRFGGSKN